jgi:predicted  nucleic acid-binding Zn-ribbon protein
VPDTPTLAEIDERIAAIRENLRELTESAAARSGAADEGFAADRIAEQEAQLASLIKQQESLSKPTSYRK